MTAYALDWDSGGTAAQMDVFRNRRKRPYFSTSTLRHSDRRFARRLTSYEVIYDGFG